MEQHEPTTEEIVKALRYCADEDKACCSGEKDNICPYYDKGLMAHPNDKNYPEYCDILLMRNAADRLESQERELSEKTEQLKDMTARAESAERERDAAIADIERMRKEKIPLCPICDFNDMIRCCHDSHCDGYQLFRWRGAGKETE